MRKILLALLLLALSSAQATTLPEWLKISFKYESPISRLYQHSMAQGVWIKTEHRPEFLPPIQYLTRPARGNLKMQSQQIATLVLKNLDVKVSGLHSSTLVMKSGPFKGGAKGDVPGYFIEYQSSQNQQIYITCMAFLKNEGEILAIYTEAYKNSLPQCTHELMNLARSEFILRAPAPLVARK